MPRVTHELAPQYGPMSGPTQVIYPNLVEIAGIPSPSVSRDNDVGEAVAINVTHYRRRISNLITVAPYDWPAWKSGAVTAYYIERSIGLDNDFRHSIAVQVGKRRCGAIDHRTG